MTMNRRVFKLLVVIILIVITISTIIGYLYWQSLLTDKVKNKLISVKVVDEETNLPIENAKVSISYLPPPCIGPAVIGFKCPPGPEGVSVEKLTDNNGLVIVYDTDKNFRKKMINNIKKFPNEVRGDEIMISAQKDSYVWDYQEIGIYDLIIKKSYSNTIITLSLIDLSKAEKDPKYCDKFSKQRKEDCYVNLSHRFKNFESCYKLPSEFFDSCVKNIVEKSSDDISAMTLIQFCSAMKNKAAQDECIRQVF